MSLRTSRATAVVLVTLATFTDAIAYSIAVPVLPDLSRRLGASPTTIGLLFASFGLTLLTVSIPMGAMSDRIGRKGPMLGGLVALAAATLLFAFADGLPWLFAARLVQGGADAVTWVVGFALLADLYGPSERGGVMGVVMSGATFAFMVGPTLGGWLYEMGGIRLPFIWVALLAVFCTLGFAWLRLPEEKADSERVSILAVLRIPAVAACTAAVVAASATLSMLEPVLPLFLNATLGAGPARIGMLFGAGALTSMAMHPVYGRLADRWGGRRLTMIGLVLTACVVPVLSLAWSYPSAIAFYMLLASTVAIIITPSLAYMAEATSGAGIESYGVGFGLYNMAWGFGLLAGPAVGGAMFELIGFPRLALIWAPCVISITILLARVKSPVTPGGPI
jgi:MFS transporter, DHA1 family, solute carrier family 18 (vesicular amine transporter), member 1/2